MALIHTCYVLTAFEEGNLLRVVSGSPEVLANLRQRCTRRPTVPRGLKPATTGWIRVVVDGRDLGWLTAFAWREMRRRLRMRGAAIAAH